MRKQYKGIQVEIDLSAQPIIIHTGNPSKIYTKHLDVLYYPITIRTAFKGIEETHYYRSIPIGVKEIFREFKLIIDSMNKKQKTKLLWNTK